VARIREYGNAIPGREEKAGKTMQELTDEKRKELDKKVENGGDENIKIAQIRSCLRQLRTRASGQSLMGWRSRAKARVVFQSHEHVL
jgi:hypothetical protein